MELAAGLQTVKVKLGGALVHAVGVSDPYCQRVAIHLGDKTPYFVHIYQIHGFVENPIFNAGDRPQLALYRNAHGVSASNHHPAFLYVFREGMMGTVIHNGGEA